MKTASKNITERSWLILAVGILVLFQPQLAYSADLYWDTTDGSGLTSGSATWDVGTTSAWATGTSPGTTAPGTWANGDSAFFQTGGTNTVTIAAGGVSANSVTQATNGTVTTIGGGALTITGTAGIVNTATTALTINSDLVFSATSARTFTINATGSTTVGGSITQGSGAAAITKTGAGTLTLSGSNSFSGGFTYNSGFVRITHGNALGSGTVSYAGNNARLELSNNITVRNDYSAGTSSTAYTLYSSSGTNTWAGNVVMKGNRIGAGVNGAALVLSGTISGSGNWIFGADDATGVLVVAGTANTYTGILQVSNGVLSANSIGSWGAGPTALGNHADVTNGAIFLGLGSAGATLRYTGTGETTNRRINMAGTSSAANVVIEQSGSGLLKFTTDFVSTGAATKTLTLQGSTAGIGEIAGAIVNNSAGNITRLTKAGSGTWILSGSSSYSGTTTITGGTLRVTNGNALGSGTVSMSGANGVLDLANNITVANSFSAGGASIPQLWSSSGSNTLVGNVAINQSRVGAGANAVLVLGGVISGTANGANNYWMNRSDAAGTVIVTGTANTYTGVTWAATGTLSASSIGNWGAGPSAFGAQTTLAAGQIQMGISVYDGALRYTGTGETTNRQINLVGSTGGAAIEQSGSGLLKFSSNLAADGAGSKTLTLQGSTAGIGEIAGAIIDNSATNKTSVTKAGSGKWVLSGSNTYTGATTINAGTLEIADGSISSSSGITNNGSLVYNLNTNARSYGNVISGNGSLTKSGSNKLTLSAANTYTGATTINSGTLSLTGAGSLANSSTITVGTTAGSNATLDVSGVTGGIYGITNGQTVGGSGVISGNIALQSGATLAPGNSPESLAIAGDLKLENGSYFQLELNKSVEEGGVVVSNWDQVTVSGLLNTSMLSEGGYTLQLSFYSVPEWTWDPAVSHTWSSFLTFGSVSGNFNTNLFTLDTSLVSGGGTWSVIQNGNALDLQYLVIPEPSVGAMILGGFGMLILGQRFRRKIV